MVLVGVLNIVLTGNNVVLTLVLAGVLSVVLTGNTVVLTVVLVGVLRVVPRILYLVVLTGTCSDRDE